MRSKAKMSRISEDALQRELLGRAAFALRDIRLFVTKPVRVPFVDEKTGKKIWVTSGLPTGFSDLTAVQRGGHVKFIELKALGGTWLEDQKRFQKWCDSWECDYLLLWPERGEQLSETVQRWIFVIREAFASTGREAARGALPLGASLEPNHDRLGGQ